MPLRLRLSRAVGLTLLGLFVSLGSGCATLGRRCGDCRTVVYCQPDGASFYDQEPCDPGRCCGCRPRLAARLAGRVDAWRVAAQRPVPEPPPLTSLHPVPTEPVFGTRLSGREAGLLSTDRVGLDETSPAQLPVVVPSPTPEPSVKNSPQLEHLNRLPNPAIRRTAHLRSFGVDQASELRFTP